MAEYIIPSGNFEISDRLPAAYVAHLGTCVGVTLRDAEANIGGIMHILLASPRTAVPPDEELYYATTGLPRFISTMLDRGASIPRLEAVVAGGALIGPISQMDIELDIGGTTANVVQRILHDSGIRILRSETGGRNGCTLHFNAATFDSNITLTGEKKAPFPSRKQISLSNEDVLRAIHSVIPLPQSSIQIMRMIQQASFDLHEIGALIREDQVLAAKVLHLINSAFFASRKPVSSIDTALVLLGEKNVSQFILSAALQSVYNDDLKGYSLIKGGLFHHATGTARISEHLARITDKAPMGLSYTAGLLHDIGKVVLDQYMADMIAYFYKRIGESDSHLIEIEKEVLGITHSEIGGKLATHWQLAPSIRNVILYHHAPFKTTKDKELVQIVYLADLLMNHFANGFEIEKMETEFMLDAMDQLHLSKRQLLDVIQEIPLYTGQIGVRNSH